MTATFSEAVTGFTIEDITVGNGSASDFVAVSSTVYTFNVTPAGDGVITVDVAAGAAQSIAGSGNTAAIQFTITYASMDPTIPPGGSIKGWLIGGIIGGVVVLGGIVFWLLVYRRRKKKTAPSR